MTRSNSKLGWGVVTGALLLGNLTASCGLTADLLTGTDGAAGASDGVDSGVAGDRADGSSGGTGSGPAGGAGRGGAAARAGSGALNGAGGSTASGGAATESREGGVAGGASVAPVDSHAAERKQLSTELCAVLQDYPCLYYVPQRSVNDPATSRADKIAQCTADVQVVGYESDFCFAEWAQEMKCLISLPRQCPCNGNDCDLGFPGSLAPRCPAEDQALQDCDSKRPTGFASSGEVSGARGTCTWYRNSKDGLCTAFCQTPALGALPVVSATCQGSPSGPQACYCEANGVQLDDWDPLPTGGAAAFYADDCAEVGQKMADGACISILDCCFTWQPVAMPGVQSIQQCSCTSDPKKDRFDSCAAIAEKGGGEVVDVCPQFVSGSGTFPN